jgi:hypothetical protein
MVADTLRHTFLRGEPPLDSMSRLFPLAEAIVSFWGKLPNSAIRPSASE